MPIQDMSCPKCGKAASEYAPNKWKCLRCGRKFIYETPSRLSQTRTPLNKVMTEPQLDPDLQFFPEGWSSTPGIRFCVVVIIALIVIVSPIFLLNHLASSPNGQEDKRVPAKSVVLVNIDGVLFADEDGVVKSLNVREDCTDVRPGDKIRYLRGDTYKAGIPGKYLLWQYLRDHAPDIGDLKNEEKIWVGVTRNGIDGECRWRIPKERKGAWDREIHP